MAVSGTETYTVNYTYNACNRLTASQYIGGGQTKNSVYTYDNNGNLLTKSEWRPQDGIAAIASYTYNNLNQLVAQSVDGQNCAYAYNAEGIRSSKAVSTTVSSYYLDGGNVVGERTGTSTTTYLRGGNLISRTSGSTTQYYLHNAHGDVVNLTNTSGNSTKAYAYDAFGNEKNQASSDANPFRYCGEYLDKETNEYYLRARYYDPAVGRFSQEDIYGGDVKDPLSLHRYLYCYHSPTGYLDRSGNVPVETVLDFLSIFLSAKDLMTDPSWVNLGFLAWDVASTFVPYLPGSYSAKGIKLVGKVDDVADVAHALSKVDDIEDAAQIVKENRSIFVSSYSTLKKWVKSLKIKGLEVHHLIEKRFSDILGVKESSILSVTVDKDTHKEITDLFRDAIGYANDLSRSGGKSVSAQDIWNAIVEVYKKMDMEQFIPILKDWIIDNAEHATDITDWKG